MSKKLTLMFAPMDVVGHVNACIGVAESLKERGHKIVFVVGKPFEGKLIPYGFEEEILINKNQDQVSKKPGEEIANVGLKLGFFSPKTPLQKLKIMCGINIFEKFVQAAIDNEPQLKVIIEKHNPDVFIVDNNIGSPQFIYSDKPWVSVISPNPLFYIKDKRTPPALLGLSVNSDKSEWIEGRELNDNMFAKASVIYNEWLTKNGFPAIPDKRLLPPSPYLNLYLYPEELDYTDVRPNPANYYRIDAVVRKGEKEFKIPEELQKKMKSSDKLIYFSLGSMGSVDVELMIRLIRMLSKSEHKFIVSKGLLGDSYELGPNMWGQNTVPQTHVIPYVDLVLTHGGNNTVTEVFSFGKPMIVLPLMTDQFDNAQRIEEKGFGVRLNPYNCTEEELFESIDRLLNDSELNEKLAVISNKILNSNNQNKISELIENLAN